MTGGSAYAVEGRAAEVLDFLLDFVEAQLLPQLDRDDRISVKTEMSIVSEAITDIQSLVRARMDRLRDGDLKGLEGRTITCPACKEWALVVDRRELRCLLCMFPWEQEAYDLPLQYAAAVLKSRNLGHENLAVECSVCASQALMSGVYVADAPEAARPFCLRCGSDGKQA